MESGLQHHGIKGMRWGVRRTDAQLGNADSASTSDNDSPKTVKGNPFPVTKERMDAVTKAEKKIENAFYEKHESAGSPAELNKHLRKVAMADPYLKQNTPVAKHDRETLLKRYGASEPEESSSGVSSGKSAIDRVRDVPASSLFGPKASDAESAAFWKDFAKRYK